MGIHIKNKMTVEKWLYPLVIVVLIIISFRLYSYNYYPLLCSDDALNVLMAHHFDFTTVYCWGQDRGGTLIPYMSQIFIALFGCSALTAVSISTYILLIIGFLSISSLFKKKMVKIGFAFVWFLPPMNFIDLLKYPIAMGFCVFFILIWIINKMIKRETKFVSSKNWLSLVLIPLILILSIWISDLCLISALLLFVALWVSKKICRNWPMVLYVIGCGVLCYTVIHFFKINGDIHENMNLSAINSPSDVLIAFKIFGSHLYHTLSFSPITIEIDGMNQSKIPYFSCSYALLLVIFLILFFTLFLIKNHDAIKQNIKNRKWNVWVFFFLINSIAVFFVCFFSNWVLKNGVGFWYFVASYISFSIFILLIVDQYSHSKFLIYLLSVIILYGALSPALEMKFVYKTLTPRAKLSEKFETLGKIGLIGSFWTTYINTITNPNLITATENDNGWTRNLKMTRDVFLQPNIYIIKNSWLDTFPDTTLQWSHILAKDGEPFMLSHFEICHYKIVGKE
jgi:hypothetical protein